MSWIKKEENVEVAAELEYENSRLDKTDAYEVEVTEAYLQNSKTSGSKSVSLVVEVTDADKQTAKSYFTIMGQDGNTFFESTYKGKKVKKQHFGLSIVNTLFMLSLDKEVFDCEPSETTFKKWNAEDKEMEDSKGDGFPELVGKKVGICLQMKREIDGPNSKEFGEITHFFNVETGLFAREEDSDNRKLDKWLKNKKDFIVKEVEKRESSFGKKKQETDGDDKPKSKWARK